MGLRVGFLVKGSGLRIEVPLHFKMYIGILGKWSSQSLISIG